MDFALTRAVLDGGLAARAFPAVSIEVGRASGPLWRWAAGHLTYAPDAPPATTDTIFDLASLTKVIATASFVMRHVTRGTLRLDAPVADYLPSWRDDEHRAVTIRHLLDHSSGLPAHARLWDRCRDLAEYELAIHALGLERRPGVKPVYSDLGFITAGAVLERSGVPLDREMRDLAAALDVSTLRYRPLPAWGIRTAPTEFDPWRNRLLQGEVHDENAAALDGVAGHAGLFGTAADVGVFARTVLQPFVEPTVLGDPPLMTRMASETGVPESSRALAWDVMRPTSSCGRRLSPNAIGHTGFSGTSLWIDRDRDLYVVLLTNRVHPSRSNEALLPIRPRVHDAVVEDCGRT